MLQPICKGKWHHYPLVLSFNLWTQLIKYAARDFHRITKPYFPRESQNLFEVSTSRSPLSLSAPSRAYFISPKRRSRKRLPEESCTRSTVKIVIVFKLVKHPGTKNTHERSRKGHSNIGWKLFVGQTPYASQSPNRFGECWNCRLVDRSSVWRQRLIL